MDIEGGTQASSIGGANKGDAVEPTLIFLDFDGVLRRVTSDPSRFDPDCLACFESTIRPFPEVQVVISSTWRLAMSLGALRRRFSLDLADRIVGVTPEAPFDATHARYREIRAYLKKRGIEAVRWVAIDDEPRHYPKTAPLLLTDPANGFDASCAERLRKMVCADG